MPSRIPARIAGWDSILFSMKQAFKVGPWSLLKSLLSKNSCKSCALGMGGQSGGMRDEKGIFPSVCKKAIWAQASDLQPVIPEDFFQSNTIEELKTRIAAGARIQRTPDHPGSVRTRRFAFPAHLLGGSAGPDSEPT